MGYLYGICPKCYLKTTRKCTGDENIECPLTCAKCNYADKCKVAFDPYNTDGDCLWEK